MRRIWLSIVVALAVMFSIIPASIITANGTTYAYTYHQIDMSGVYNSDAYTGGQNYTYSTAYYYRVDPTPLTTYSDPNYGNVPMDMRGKGQNNVWLSHGNDRTSAFPQQITLTVNIQNAAIIWLVGFDAGWGGNTAPVEVKYKLDGADTTVTYTPNDWSWIGSGDENLASWVKPSGSVYGDISVARIVLPYAGYLTEITVTDPDTPTGYWGKSFPIFAVTVAQLTTVNVDVKPMSSPNPFNVNAKGVLPVAILGTETFDVSQIDPALVKLEGVEPLRWALEDVGTASDPLAGPDGYLDLTYKFDSQEIAGIIGTVNDGDIVTLNLTGNGIIGDDEIVIIKKK